MAPEGVHNSSSNRMFLECKKLKSLFFGQERGELGLLLKDFLSVVVDLSDFCWSLAG